MFIDYAFKRRVLRVRLIRAAASGTRNSHARAKYVRPYGTSTSDATMAGCRVPINSLIPHAIAAPPIAEIQSCAMYAADSPVRPIL